MYSLVLTVVNYWEPTEHEVLGKAATLEVLDYRQKIPMTLVVVVAAATLGFSQMVWFLWMFHLQENKRG